MSSSLSNQPAQPEDSDAIVEPVASELDDDELGTFYSILDENESTWRDKQAFLESKGFMLRPRYRLGWVPSWRGTSKQPEQCEDSIILPLARKHLIDATRISDGKLVYVKRVATNDKESSIAIMLSSKEHRRDPRNHAVPILDHFQDDQDPSVSYIVMPFLRLIDSPPFETVQDVVSFCDQILEGLVFLHERGVAHRDCSDKNIMMDADALYPNGFHPVNINDLPDGITRAKPLQRSAAAITYYYVDFGISVIIQPDIEPKLATGNLGRDQEPPELQSDDKPYDPFKLDIFIIGNALRRKLQDLYSNVDFLKPLIDSMIQRDPSVRPDAVAAFRQWQNVRNSQGVHPGETLECREAS